MNAFLRVFILSFISYFTLTGCQHEPVKEYYTQNVVVIVIDGPRYSETWGAQNRENIPYKDALSEDGVLCNNFYNNGGTYTNAGHTAIVTGIYQQINNGGLEYPQNPSMFQHWLSQSPEKHAFAKIIASKDKLEILSDCVNPAWNGKCRPEHDCGINGLGTGYREDSVTFVNTMNILAYEQPRLLLVCFKDPDYYAHSNDSIGYIHGIKKSDEYVQLIWAAIQSSPHYSGKTTLLVTNDHGRHTTDFTSHGDACIGCRHIECLALSPDFKKGFVCSTAYEQIDIAPTVAELMGFHFDNLPGDVMWDLFKNPHIN